MGNEIQVLGSDGKPVKYSPDVPIVDADGRKLVPEADLMAVKNGAEKQVSDAVEAAKATISELKQKADTHYQEMLRERGSKEELGLKVKGLTSTVEELNTKLKDAGSSSEALKKAQEALLGLKKTRITELYPNMFKPEELNGKTEADLDTLETALKLVKGKAQTNYDGAGGGGGALIPGSKQALGAAIEAAKLRK
jgi:predicted RNase H-like nuclease (RuvC/YqgF family)